ncbi:MAG TPA: methylated-DNA--[protein]-cysteine S-methyltransferase [Pilimelia sp.]|nr:methylated-DNA--[protein]-cysteine S-methyltransferase [Pilimelia sp.]
MRWNRVTTPVGELAVAADDGGVCAVRFPPVTAADGVPDDPSPAGDDPVLAAVADQLRAYFAGELLAFALPLSVRGGSAFERAVWAELRRIPYGETRTYGQVAAAVGDAGAARAVGVACHRNPHAVVVPCHRVVGAGGKLVGFGGGLPRKSFLLELEGGVAMRRAWS